MGDVSTQTMSTLPWTISRSVTLNLTLTLNLPLTLTSKTSPKPNHNPNPNPNPRIVKMSQGNLRRQYRDRPNPEIAHCNSIGKSCMGLVHFRTLVTLQRVGVRVRVGLE